MRQFAFLLLVSALAGQPRLEPGRAIGKVSTNGNLVVMELDEGVLGKANMFDRAGRTLRFTPDGQGYRIENAALAWDAEFGRELSGAQASLHNFQFPFSGKSWDSLSVGVTGSIAFGSGTGGGRGGAFGGGGGRGGGVSIARFDQLRDGARNLNPSSCPKTEIENYAATPGRRKVPGRTPHPRRARRSRCDTPA